MEKQLKISTQGQEIISDDLSALAASALMDDVVFQELLKLKPYGGLADRAIIPSSQMQASGKDFVSAVAAAGTLEIQPFRAIIGARVDKSTDISKSIRDIRSAYVIGSSSARTPNGAIRLSDIPANFADGPSNVAHSRWDLVYASVTIDANAPTVARYVKDPSTNVIAATNIVTSVQTNVAIGILGGTSGATPTPPAISADTGGVYYIPICYVRIPHGFIHTSSTIAASDIFLAMPHQVVDASTGAASMGPSSSNSVKGESVLSTTATQSWGALVSPTRPKAFIPPDMLGSVSKIVAIDLTNSSSANWSHANGAVIDDSIDWRNRLFVSQLSINAAPFMPWHTYDNSSGGVVDGTHSTTVNPVWVKMGQSLRQEFANPSGFSGSSNGIVFYLDDVEGNAGPLSTMQSSSSIALYVDSSTGALKMWIVGSPQVNIVGFIQASGQYSNK